MTGDRAAEVRTEVREFLSRTLPDGWAGFGALDPDTQDDWRETWRKQLVEGRYLVPSWPERYGGRDADLVEQTVIAQEFIRAGVPTYPVANDPLSLTLLGPTLLKWGNEEQKERFLPATVSGEMRWAQGYSEPEAGSDLFSLRTRAERTPEGWRVNGQKMWQTGGMTANWIFVLVRTDPTAEKSKGLSFVLIPLNQRGVEVRAIRNILGEDEFAEVYFTDVHVADENVVGGVGNGAQVALTLLGFERALGGFTASVGFEIELDRLVELVRAKDLADDPLVRDRIARCATRVHAISCLSRNVLAQLEQGIAPGPESSLIKLLSSEYRQQVTSLALDLLGDEVLAPSGSDGAYTLGPQPVGLDPRSSSAWLRDYLQARPGTVYGGSSQIQRNTIGERILGLPREPRPTGGAK